MSKERNFHPGRGGWEKQRRICVTLRWSVGLSCTTRLAFVIHEQVKQMSGKVGFRPFIWRAWVSPGKLPRPEKILAEGGDSRSGSRTVITGISCSLEINFHGGCCSSLLTLLLQDSSGTNPSWNFGEMIPTWVNLTEANGSGPCKVGCSDPPPRSLL